MILNTYYGSNKETTTHKSKTSLILHQKTTANNLETTEPTPAAQQN